MEQTSIWRWRRSFSPSHEYATGCDVASESLADRHADLERCERSYWGWFRDPCGNVEVVPAIPIESLALLVGNRSLYERMSSHHQFHREWRGDGCGESMEGEVTPEQLKAGLSQQGHSK